MQHRKKFHFAYYSSNCFPNSIGITNRVLDLNENTDIVLKIRLTRNGTTEDLLLRSSDVPNFDYDYGSFYALEQLLEFIGISVARSGGGVAPHFISYYGTSIEGGDGSTQSDPITIEFMMYDTSGNEFDLFQLLFSHGQSDLTIRSCGFQNFEAI